MTYVQLYPSSANLPSCSTPVGREHLPTVDGEFGPFVSPVESLLGSEQTSSVDEEPISDFSLKLVLLLRKLLLRIRYPLVQAPFLLSRVSHSVM